MPRAVTLSVVKGGIDRLRVRGAKGGSSKGDAVYDLVNGHVTASGTVKVRPGTRREIDLATPPADTATQLEDNPNLRVYAQSVTHGGYLYSLGGQESGELPGTQTVTRTRDGVTWETMPTPDWSARTSFAAIVHKGYIYVIGGRVAGQSGQAVLNDIWRSRDGSTWTQVSTGQFTARSHLSAVSIDDNIVITPGQNAVFGTVAGYAISTDDGATFGAVTTPPAGSIELGGTMAVLNDVAYLIGGSTTGSSADMANTIYSSTTGDVWTALGGLLPENLGLVGAVAFKDVLHIVGGYGTTGTDGVRNWWLTFDGVTVTTVLANGHVQFDALARPLLGTPSNRLIYGSGITGASLNANPPGDASTWILWVDYPSTIGLTAFDGKLHVFSSELVPILDARVVVDVLPHPDGEVSALETIHFAAPFLGFLYVVAEFADGRIAHYWLQDADAWEPDTEYSVNDVVEPAGLDNGFLYRATRLTQPFPSWVPNVPRVVGEFIEPTVYNGFYFECIAVQGDNPTSQSTEPNWPTETGAQIIESVAQQEADETTGGTPPEPPPPSGAPGAVGDRYGAGGTTEQN